jgi:hypothetical protein
MGALNMTATIDDADGVIVLPRRASFWAAATVLLGILGQSVTAGVYVAKLDARFEAIETRLAVTTAERAAEDTRILKRGDDRFGQITARLESLERDRSVERDRLVRLEEQSRAANELLREIRQDIRRR